jgi:hypothetical protein
MADERNKSADETGKKEKSKNRKTHKQEPEITRIIRTLGRFTVSMTNKYTTWRDKA